MAAVADVPVVRNADADDVNRITAVHVVVPSLIRALSIVINVFLMYSFFSWFWSPLNMAHEDRATIIEMVEFVLRSLLMLWYPLAAVVVQLISVAYLRWPKLAVKTGKLSDVGDFIIFGTSYEWLCALSASLASLPSLNGRSDDWWLFIHSTLYAFFTFFLFLHAILAARQMQFDYRIARIRARAVAMD